MEILLIYSFFLVSISGVLFHYTHQWFKHGVVVHMFSAVNESTWEHMKLAFSPIFFVAFLQSFFLSFEYKNFWFAMLFTLFLAVFLVPALYYPIRAILGREVTFISISLYFVSVGIAFVGEYYILVGGWSFMPEILALITLILLPFVFLLLTFHPPKFFLFKDPVKKKYGDFSKH